MQVPVQINFLNMPSSDAVEARIRERTDQLERVFPRITACRVAVGPEQRSTRKGRLYHVRVDVTVPGNELVVNRGPGDNHAHEDVYVAIRDAFDQARRQLEDHADKVRGA